MALQQPITLAEHQFVEELITLWEYVRCHLVSATYKIEEEQIIFGDARLFELGHRQQLFELAQLRFADRVRGIRIEKSKQFYQELLANVRNRAHIASSEFYLRCRTAYKTARANSGASNRVLRIKVNKVAKVTHYFSQLKLWKDCTTDPIWQWLRTTKLVCLTTRTAISRSSATITTTSRITTTT